MEAGKRKEEREEGRKERSARARHPPPIYPPSSHPFILVNNQLEDTHERKLIGSSGSGEEETSCSEGGGRWRRGKEGRSASKLTSNDGDRFESVLLPPTAFDCLRDTRFI